VRRATTTPPNHIPPVRGSGSVRPLDSSVDFPSRPVLVIHGLSTQKGIFLAKPDRASNLHWPQPVSSSLSAERGCQPQHEQPHWEHFGQDRCCSGLPPVEHHPGGQRQPPQVGRANKISQKGMSSVSASCVCVFIRSTSLSAIASSQRQRPSVLPSRLLVTPLAPLLFCSSLLPRCILRFVCLP